MSSEITFLVHVSILMACCIRPFVSNSVVRHAQRIPILYIQSFHFIYYMHFAHAKNTRVPNKQATQLHTTSTEYSVRHSTMVFYSYNMFLTSCLFHRYQPFTIYMLMHVSNNVINKIKIYQKQLTHKL
ncbi:hypothetical protein BJX76DRAFT_230950 [Aspergillus varians]